MVLARESEHFFRVAPAMAECGVIPFRLLALHRMKFDSVMADIFITEIPVAEVTNVEESCRPPHTGVEPFTTAMILKAIFHPRAAYCPCQGAICRIRRHILPVSVSCYFPKHTLLFYKGISDRLARLLVEESSQLKMTHVKCLDEYHSPVFPR